MLESHLINMEDLKKVCKTCKHRSRYDDLWYMIWWSICQTKCKLLNGLKFSKRRSWENENQF